MDGKWWQRAIVYQIYVKSFKDSDGDGIGDLKGVMEKLPYLAGLGIDVIWLCPVFKSPMADNGYDISDYREIDPIFGSMKDMEMLIEEAEKLGIKILMDLVVNHSSDEHPWFLEARSSKDNQYRDYYIWKDSVDGKEPNNWRSIFGGSVWEWDEATSQYYFHVFHKKQPDLNWENPKLRQEVADIINWWLDKGIGGFRVDAITYIKKRKDYKSFEPDKGETMVPVGLGAMNQPGIHDFLEEINEKCFSKYDIMTVAEAPGVPEEDIGRYIGDVGHFSMIFDFTHIDMDLPADGMWFNEVKWGVPELKKALEDVQRMTEKNGWGSLYIENHDQPRSPNKFLKKEKNITLKSSKMLAGMYFFLKGTPFIYQGQEIGMTNVKYPGIEEYNDIASIDQYYSALERGFTQEEALGFLWRRSRDNSRTPMQWDASENAGFTSGKPWLKLNENYLDTNVSNAVSDEGSLYHFYKSLIELRKSDKYGELLTHGQFKALHKTHKGVIAYSRELDGEKIVVLANFGGKKTRLKLKSNIQNVVISNINEPLFEEGKLVLEPFDLLVFEAK